MERWKGRREVGEGGGESLWGKRGLGAKIGRKGQAELAAVA